MRTIEFGEDGTRTEALRDLVCVCPSIFGRLVSVATLREINPSGLVGLGSPCSLQENVAGLHQDLFSSWLNMSLKQQKADMAIYLARIGTRPIALSSLLARIQTLIPAEALDTERHLFLEDMALVYTMLCPEWEKEPAAQSVGLEGMELPVKLPAAGDARAA